ncbi:MAG: hypothetical protein ACKOUM_00245 [Sphingopyxis sp.]
MMRGSFTRILCGLMGAVPLASMAVMPAHVAAQSSAPASAHASPARSPAHNASAAEAAARAAAAAAAQAANAAELRTYHAMPDTPGTGAYPAVMEMDAGLAAHVIYRPANLAAMGDRKLGVLVWGNGGCRADGASARLHLAEIASHGYLVIAPGTIATGPSAPAAPATTTPAGADNAGQPAPRAALPAPATSAADVRAGIDWALAENARTNSRYHGRIDTAAVAVGGHSCGGLQALQVAADPRIRTVMVHNSGVFADGSNPIAGLTVDKGLLNGVHTPIIYILGGPGDVAYPNGTDDVRRIDHVPTFLLDMPVGHGGTFRQANGGAVAQVSVDWLDWQLRGDEVAGRSFSGAMCRLCVVPGWTVTRKNMP